MNKKVLILGVTSFGGSSFFKFLRKKINFDIQGTYRSNTTLKKLFKNNLKEYNFVKLDLSKKNNNLIKIIKKFKPNYIFDFASVCLVNESWENPKYYLDVNYFSKINLIKNLKEFRFLKKFIYISTPEVFGSTPRPVKENYNIFTPSTPYALSKLNMEQAISIYNNEAKKFIIVRASNFYGLDQLDHRLIPKLIKYIKNKKKFPMHGNGNSIRNFIFEDDFNLGLLKVLLNGKIGKIYHFSSNKYLKINEIIKITCKTLNVDFRNSIKKVKDRVCKDKYYFLDCKKTIKELNWSPKISFKNGLKKIIAHKNKIK